MATLQNFDSEIEKTRATVEDMRQKLGGRTLTPIQLNSFEVRSCLARIHGIRLDRPGVPGRLRELGECSENVRMA